MTSTTRTIRTARTARTARTVVRASVALALAGGVLGVSATTALAASGPPAPHRVVQHVSTKAHAGAHRRVVVRLGPAVAYVRGADGTVTRTR